ncbi:MAG: deoxyribose-phosphate aldolase [Methanocellales archaeon]|nr:deoxyribose-phosphate aldolase [Methanocellales archaeon]
MITREQLAKTIDHTLLRSDATADDIRRLCIEAKEYHFASVCVNPIHVSLATGLLKKTDIKVCTVIGFPLGATTSDVKAFEAKNAIENGAREVDMVMNIGAFKSGDYDVVKKDIKAVVDAADGRIVKVIIETGLLTDEEKIKACQLVKEAGADFVKTSTGFYGKATVRDVALMRKAFGKGVKASGGIRTWKDAIALIKAGATRIGTSTGVAIVQSTETAGCKFKSI